MKRSDFQPGVKFKIRRANNVLGVQVFEYQHSGTIGDQPVEVVRVPNEHRSMNIELNDTSLQLYTTFGGVMLQSNSIELEKLEQVDSSVTNPTSI